MTRLAVRPQPLGIFPLPAAYLVLPPVEGVEAALPALLRGELPAELPPGLAFFGAALAGDPDAAWRALAADPAPEARYNRLVLRGTVEEYLALRDELRGDLALLAELLAYTQGWADEPPAPGDATGELRACVLAAHAAAALEREAFAEAEQILAEAAAAARGSSPLLAAQLLGDQADARWQGRGPDPLTLQQYRSALDLLDGRGLPTLRAQLALKLGICYHELARNQREPLQEAVRHYQEALQVLTRQQAPELFALAQNNLALAYLAMPLTEASDQLRMGIAVQALREALKVYTRAAFPEQWASAQLNLANALQYLPSSHPEENLAEAVGLYEELLQARDPADDPAGYARLLANQGNALSHLGIFDHARPKLERAAQLFALADDQDGAATVAEALAALEQHALAAEEPR